MPKRKTVALTFSLLLAAGSAAWATGLAEQPYAGEQTRQIKTLSDQDIDDLLAGRGWGLAKPAELNGYPGPAHVLELADKLGLNEQQLAAVRAIFERMRTDARGLGAAYVEAERRIEKAFAGNAIDEQELETLLGEAEDLRARLRQVHLAAHIETKPVLSRHQRMRYDALRGYDSAQGSAQGSDHRTGGHGGHGGN